MNKTLLSIIIFLYSSAVEIALVLLLPILSPMGRRRGWDLPHRKKMPRIVRVHRCRSIVWVHAASLGEAKLLLQFLMVLERRNPDDCYVVTATSRAGVDHLKTMKRPSIHAIGFLPFDTLRLMTSLLETFSIARLWLIETELWPAMLFSCFRRNVPVGIANARMEKHSFTHYRKFRVILAPLFKNLDIVLAQNETYAERFLTLGVARERLHIVGNMKTHVQIRPPLPDERNLLRKALQLADDDMVIAAGCFHAGEGTLLRIALDELHARGRRCKCIVVPRHLRESYALAEELGSGVLRLHDCAAKTPWELCLIEKLGILEPMYRTADAAIVGGTFIDIGGHNVWEAAQAGIPVFFGPHYFEQRSGCERLLAAGVGFIASNAQELANGLEKALWTGRERFSAARALFTEETNSRQAILEPLIP
jgi:3-deoxy-D-manno-octulosonic-acid transferase